MTEEERDAVLVRIEQWLFEPPALNKPNRADQIDGLLAGLKAGKMSVRAFLWLCGVIAIVAAAWGQLKGFIK